MPTTNKGAKAVFDSGKTSSYHINSVVSCQSGKSSSSAFRIVVHRDGDRLQKRTGCCMPAQTIDPRVMLPCCAPKSGRGTRELRDAPRVS